MSTPSEEVQKLLTNTIVNLYKFDFSSIGINSQIYFATSFQTSVSGDQPWNYRGLINNNGEEVFGFRLDQFDANWYDGANHHYVGIKGDGFANDMTGQVSNPTLTMAAYDLWKIPEWAAITAGLNISDYRGVTVFRQRIFYNVLTPIIPQRYFIQGVENLDSATFKITLTPTLGNENLSQPSARTLEL
jgi:phage-related protein